MLFFLGVVAVVVVVVVVTVSCVCVSEQQRTTTTKNNNNNNNRFGVLDDQKLKCALPDLAEIKEPSERLALVATDATAPPTWPAP